MSVINWFSKIADWKIISDKTWLTFLIPLYGPMGRFWLPGRDDLVLPLIKSIVTMKLFSFQNLAWNDLSTAQLFPTPAIPENVARRCGPSMANTFPLGVFSNSVTTFWVSPGPALVSAYLGGSKCYPFIQHWNTDFQLPYNTYTRVSFI